MDLEPSRDQMLMSLYLAWIRRQLGLHGEGAPGDGVSVVRHVDGVQPLLCGGVADQADVCPAGLRLHFAGHRALTGTQLPTHKNQ